MADFYDPRFQGLFTLGSGLLAAAGPQQFPVSFGQAFGQGGLNAVRAMQQARQQQVQMEDALQQRALREAQLKRINDVLASEAEARQQNALFQGWVGGLNTADLTQFGGPNLTGPQGAMPGGQIRTESGPELSGIGPQQPPIYGTPVSPSDIGPAGQSAPIPQSQMPPAQPLGQAIDPTQAPPVNVTSKYQPWDVLNAQADYLEQRAAALTDPEASKRAQGVISALRGRADRLQQAYDRSRAAPTVQMVPIGQVNGVPMEQPYQWSKEKNTWIPVPGSQARPVFSSQPAVNVDIKTGDSFWKEFGKGQADFIVKQADTAQQAADAVNIIHSMRRNLDGGMFTGLKGGVMLQAGRALASIGFKASSDPVANTQAYAAEAGQLVGQIIKQFGSGTGLSDADRQYAERIAAGDISLDESALRKLLDIHEKADRIIIRRFNKRIGDLKKRAGKEGLPLDMSIEEPAPYIGGKNPGGGDWTVRPAR